MTVDSPKRDMDAGHSNQWKDTSMAIGFTMRPAAAGQMYHLAMIHPTIRREVHELALRIGDGRPEFRTFAIPTCRLNHGLLGQHRHRGGTSRSKGSGSRMRLWERDCTPKPVKVRIAIDAFRATCDLSAAPRLNAGKTPNPHQRLPAGRHPRSSALT